MHKTVHMRHVLLLLLLPFALLTADEWKAPADACAVANPLAADPAATSQGQSVYDKNCAFCHGATGNGDGAGAAYLHPRPAKLSDPEIQSQSDGSLFWKIAKGRNLMVGWAGSLSTDNRWALVDFIRSLAAKH